MNSEVINEWWNSRSCYFPPLLYHVVRSLGLCLLFAMESEEERETLIWTHSPYYRFASEIFIKSESGHFSSLCCPSLPNQSVFLCPSFVETCLSAALLVCCRKRVIQYESRWKMGRWVSGVRRTLLSVNPGHARKWKTAEIQSQFQNGQARSDGGKWETVVYLPRIPHLPLN